MALVIEKRSDEDDRLTVVMRFGGGLNTQAVQKDIDGREAAEGKNFDLQTDKRVLKARRAIKKVATATNGERINGFIQLRKSDGSRSVCVQAGSAVYTWDGTSSGFTHVRNVNSGARLRGPLEANSIKDDKVYIADLARVEPVLTWDGTSMVELAHNLTGKFYAKYIVVENERAFYANCENPEGTNLPHVLVVSKSDDLDNLSTSNRPSSGLAATDPFFLNTPNLSPIRGLISAFGRVVIATESANWYELTGTSATDHGLGDLYSGARATGAESVAFVGNDIVFGKVGGIDSLTATDKFGDVQADDLTRWIADDVRQVQSWTLAYSPRWQKLYCVPLNGGKVYVLHKGFLDARVRQSLFGAQAGELSPWSLWTTDLTFNFEPTVVQLLLDPDGGQEYIYMGDRSGNIWQVEADSAQDDGTTDIPVEYVSAPISIFPARSYKVTASIEHRLEFAETVTLSLLWGGKERSDGNSVSITLDAASNAPVWNGTTYWGGDGYWNSTFSGKRRAISNEVTLEGGGDIFQVKVAISSNAEIDIEQILLQFEPQSGP